MPYSGNALPASANLTCAAWRAFFISPIVVQSRAGKCGKNCIAFWTEERQTALNDAGPQFALNNRCASIMSDGL